MKSNAAPLACRSAVLPACRSVCVPPLQQARRHCGTAAGTGCVTARANALAVRNGASRFQLSAYQMDGLDHILQLLARGPARRLTQSTVRRE